jgi:hypothetical protein
MRHLLTSLAAAAFVAGLAFASGPASAAPLPKIDGPAAQTSAVEPVGYYRWRGPYRRGYYAHRYRPYYWGYYRPWRPYPYYRRYWW